MEDLGRKKVAAVISAAELYRDGSIFHMLGGAVGIYCAAHASGQVEAALWLVVAVASLMIGQPWH